MVLDAIQQVLTVGASLAVIIGVIVALMQLRDQARLRQLEIVMRLYASFGEEGFTRHYQRVANWKYKTYAAFRKRATREDQVSLVVVGAFFENMGLLLKRGYASIELLDDLLSAPILEIWPKSKPIWVGLRNKHDHPAWAEWFEYLYEAMAARKERLEAKKAGVPA